MSRPWNSRVLTVLAVIFMVTSTLPPVAAAGTGAGSAAGTPTSSSLDFSGADQSLASNLNLDGESASPASAATDGGESPALSGVSTSPALQYTGAGPQLDDLDVTIVTPPESNSNGVATVRVVVDGTYEEGTYPWRIPVTVTASSGRLSESTVVTLMPSNGTQDYRGVTQFTFRFTQPSTTAHTISVDAETQSSGQSDSTSTTINVNGASEESAVTTNGQIRNDDVSEEPHAVSRVSRYKTDDRADGYLEDASLPVGFESNVTNFTNARVANDDYAIFEGFRGDMNIGTLTTGIPNGTAQTLVIHYRSLSGDDIRLTPVDGDGFAIDNSYMLAGDPSTSENCHEGDLADLCVFRLSDREVNNIGAHHELILSYNAPYDASAAIFCQDVVTGAMPSEGSVCGLGTIGDYSDGRIVDMYGHGAGNTVGEGRTLSVPSGTDVSFDIKVENMGNLGLTETVTLQSRDGTFGPVTRTVSLGDRGSATATFSGFTIDKTAHTFVATFDGSREEIRVVPDGLADDIPPVADSGGPYRVALDRTGRTVSRVGTQQQTLSERPGPEWTHVQNVGTSSYDDWTVQVKNVPVISSIASLEGDSTNNVSQMNSYLSQVHGDGTTVQDVYSEELTYAESLLPPNTDASDWSLHDVVFTTKVRTERTVDTDRPEGYGWVKTSDERMVSTGQYEYEQFRAQPNSSTSGLSNTELDTEGGRWVVDYSRPNETKLVGYQYNNTTEDPDKYDADTNDSDGVFDWEQYQWYGTRRVVDDFINWDTRLQDERYDPGGNWTYVGMEGSQYEYVRPTYTEEDVWTWRMPVYSEYYWYKRPIQEMAYEYQRQVYDAEFIFRSNVGAGSTISLWEGPQYGYEDQYESVGLTMNASDSYDEGPPSMKGIARYDWLFEDGSTANGVETTKDYGTPFGWYYPELKVYDNAGNMNNSTFGVHVIPNESCVGSNCGEVTPLRPDISINDYNDPVDRNTERVWVSFNISGSLDRSWTINLTAPDAQPNLSQEVWESYEIVNGEEQIDAYVDPDEANIPKGDIEFVINATPTGEDRPVVTETFTVQIYTVPDRGGGGGGGGGGESCPNADTAWGQRDSDKDGSINACDPCPEHNNNYYLLTGTCLPPPPHEEEYTDRISWNTSDDFDTVHLRDHITHRMLLSHEQAEGSRYSLEEPRDYFWIGYPTGRSSHPELIAYYSFDGESLNHAYSNEYAREWEITDHRDRWNGRNNAEIFHVDDGLALGDFIRSDPTEGPNLQFGGIYNGEAMGLQNGRSYLEIISPYADSGSWHNNGPTYERAGDRLTEDFDDDITISFWAQATSGFGFEKKAANGQTFYSFQKERNNNADLAGHHWEYKYLQSNGDCINSPWKDCKMQETWQFGQYVTTDKNGNGNEQDGFYYLSWQQNAMTYSPWQDVTPVSSSFKNHAWNHYAYSLNGGEADGGHVEVYRNGNLIFSKSAGYLHDNMGNQICVHWSCPVDTFWWRLNSPTGSFNVDRFIWGGTWKDSSGFAKSVANVNFDEVRVYNDDLSAWEIENNAFIDREGHIHLYHKEMNESGPVKTDAMNLTFEGSIPGGNHVVVDVVPWTQDSNGQWSADHSHARTVSFFSSSLVMGSATKEVPDLGLEKAQRFSLDVSLYTDTDTETPQVSNLSLSHWTKPNASRQNYKPNVYLNEWPNPANADEDVSFQGIGDDPDGKVVSYNFNWGDGTTDTSGSVNNGKEIPVETHQFECAGSYDVTFSVTDDGGAANETTTTVDVTNTEPNADASPNTQTIGPGDTATFSASGSNDPDGSIEEYRWEFEDGTTMYGPSVAKTFNEPGTHDVVLMVEDNACETDSETVRVTVTNNPPNAVASVSPDAGDEETDFRFDGSSSYDPDGSITSYSWDFDGDGDWDSSGSVSSGSNIPTVTHSYSEGGEYTARLRVTDSYGKSGTDTVKVDVDLVDGEDCSAILKNDPSASSGWYTISPNGNNQYNVYCEMDYLGGGWTVINDDTFSSGTAGWTSDEPLETRGGWLAARCNSNDYTDWMNKGIDDMGIDYNQIHVEGDAAPLDSWDNEFLRMEARVDGSWSTIDEVTPKWDDNENFGSIDCSTSHGSDKKYSFSGDFVGSSISDVRFEEGAAQDNSDESLAVDNVEVWVRTGAATVAEVGRTTVAGDNPSNWDTINLQNDYTNPVVVMKPMSEHGGNQGHIRVKNVQSDSFQARVEEWSNEDDSSHSTVTVSYIVMEEGAHTLTDGTTVEAGIVNTDENAQWASFTSGHFSSTPVVFTNTQTHNGNDAVTTRNYNVGTGGFYTFAQEDEANGGHAVEEIGYIAIERGTGSIGSTDFKVGRTPNTVTDSWYQIDFGGSYPSGVVMDMQTEDGGDTADLRHRDHNSNNVDVRVEEGDAGDSETSHTSEVIGWMAWDGSGTLTSGSGPSGELNTPEPENPHPPLLINEHDEDATDYVEVIATEDGVNPDNYKVYIREDTGQSVTWHLSDSNIGTMSEGQVAGENENGVYGNNPVNSGNDWKVELIDKSTGDVIDCVAKGSHFSSDCGFYVSERSSSTDYSYYRNKNDDTDSASDWSTTTSESRNSRNPGQSADW